MVNEEYNPTYYQDGAVYPDGNIYYPANGQQVMGFNNYVSPSASFVSVHGSENTIGNDCRYISLVNSSGCIVQGGLQNVSILNSSGVIVTEGNVSYVRGLRTEPTGFLKITKSYSDWQPNAGASGAITQSIPAGAIITLVKVKHNVKFIGGGITDVQFQVFETTNTNMQYISALVGTPYNMASNPSATNGTWGAPLNNTNTIQETILIPDHDTAWTLDLEIGLSGGVINDLTQGSVDIWIEYKILR